jgi:tetratricopeptide (TPR) repeat protein
MIPTGSSTLFSIKSAEIPDFRRKDDMNGMPKYSRVLLPAIFTTVLLCVSFTACRMSSQRRSFTGRLDEIDALIAQGEDDDAVRELKKAEKYMYDSWSRIGIFRRYRDLGEMELAEKVLKKGIRKNPKSLELAAVYSNFLLRNGNIDEAMKRAELLRGTKYGSVYSEAFLAAAVRDGVHDISSFSGEKFYNAFYDAYALSKDAYWLRNCAVISLAKGEYDKAASISPESCTEPEDAYFWAMAMYDDRQYGPAAAFAQDAETMYPAASIHSHHSVSPVEIASILSDSYVSLSETDEAEKVRRDIMARVEQGDPSVDADSRSSQAMLPVIYVNSALYAEASGDDDECRRLLTYTADTWPYFVPGLSAYADFAYRTSQSDNEDDQELTLRDNGLATLKMEKFDSRARLPVSDAEYRMDRALEENSDPRLYLARLDLKYRTDASLSREDKIADVWKELEKSATGTDLYPPLILDYAVNVLLRNGQTDDAYHLFCSYVTSKYGFDRKRDFWEQIVSSLDRLPLQEAEYAAWFAADQKKADTAVRLYEYCVYESGGSSAESSGRKIAGFVSTPSCINLAMIYDCLGEVPQSIELYGRAAARAADTREKAEALYRMAAIYASQKNTKEALRSAGYALALNPGHARAKLLRSRLMAAEPENKQQ